MKKDTILIDKIVLENIFLRYKNKNANWVKKGVYFSSSSMISLGLSKITTDTYGTFLWFDSYESKILITILLTLSVCAFLISCSLWIYFYHKGEMESVDTLQQNIIGHNKYEEDFTYILLFPKYEKGQLRFLVMKKDSWENSYFFPYLKHQFGDENISANESAIKDEIRKKYGIDIPIYVKEITPSVISVTKLKNGMPKDFHFRFLYINSTSPFFRTYLFERMENIGFSGMTIEQISEDKTTAVNNGKVLSVIEENLSEIRRLCDISKKERTKIIWNVDKRCNKGCNICVYGRSSMSEIDKEELLSIADSILSVDVGDIDLSVGNEANVDDMKHLIEYIKGKSKINISITATSDILSEIGFEFLNKNISEIEITYDYPHDKEWKSGIRPVNYNKENIELAKSFYSKNPKFRITINIILHKDMNVQSLKAILRELNKNNFTKYNLLRLMPLGNVSLADYPSNLYDRRFYEDLFNAFKKSNPHIHCALRGLKNDQPLCRMGHSKLGISSNGDVYVCAWAEHINKDEDNPFYVGNLEESDNLKSLLVNNEKFISIIEHEQTKDCKLFSCLQGRDMWSGTDKLYN